MPKTYPKRLRTSRGRLRVRTSQYSRLIPIADEPTAAEEREILDWLSIIDPSEKHREIWDDIELNNPGSGGWFLQSKEFQDWKSYPQSFLWLIGSCMCELFFMV